MNFTKYMVGAACLAFVVSGNVSAMPGNQGGFGFNGYNQQNYQGYNNQNYQGYNQQNYQGYGDSEDRFGYGNRGGMDLHARPSVTDPSQGQNFLNAMDKPKVGAAANVGGANMRKGRGFLSGVTDKFKRMFDKGTSVEEMKKLAPEFCERVKEAMVKNFDKDDLETLNDMIKNPSKFDCKADDASCLSAELQDAMLARNQCFK